MTKELTIQDLQPKEIMRITASTGLVPRELQPYVQPALEEFRNEMAAELGIADYAVIDKGDLPSRLNGKVGGGMTKKNGYFCGGSACLELSKQENVS